MDVRAQAAMVFHLDKCVGCHTCSVACKNVWTDRAGAEYMWWNNVETKPGTGYPIAWEDQSAYEGGWVRQGDGDRARLRLRSQGRAGGLLKLFYNAAQPGLEDYYEPWTYRYEDLFTAGPGEDPPTARPVSLVTGEPIDLEAGPNWDDDLSGSPVYAENDPNLDALDAAERAALFEVERMAMMYLPRICNHCANPSCVASCPSGALYKRGEDGVVLVDQDRCRGWRACVTACPYKKVYFNWKTGKSEKCLLCYPRLETGQPPACFHACVGRIRYMGVLLYDAERIEAAMKAPDASIVEAQRSVLLDPDDPEVVREARRGGLPEQMLEAARRSPVRRFVLEWQLALPLHAEFRTLPMLYYVPPLLPIMGRLQEGVYGTDAPGPEDVFAPLDRARLPLTYLAKLFSAGNVEVLRPVMKKLMAVRHHMRSRDLPEPDGPPAEAVLAEAGLTAEQAEAIYRLTALATLEERYVMPPIQRETLLGEERAQDARGESGFGGTASPRRGP